LDFGFWVLDFGFWVLDFGFWIQVTGEEGIGTRSRGIWVWGLR
jgi:hypothetical protein